MFRLKAIVQEEIVATKKLLEEIELKQSPSIHYSELLDFFKELCDYALSVVENIPEYLKQNPGNQKVEQILKRMVLLASYVVRQINSYCDSFDYADRLTISSATIQILNKLLRAVTKHRAFILRGTTEYNYMYEPIGETLNSLASRLAETISTLDASFAILTFPLANKNNMLSNCNLLHELGHLVVDSEGLTNKLDEALGKEKQDRVADIIQRHARVGTQYDFEYAQRKDRFNKILKNWIHEVMADFIGLYLLGPAHLLAFLQIIEPLGAYQKDDDEHPCSSIRVKMMIDVLCIMKWDRHIELECPKVWKRAKDISTLLREEDNVYDASAECLPIILEDILEIVKRLCRRNTYKPETFLSSKDNIYALLERGIPPAEMIVEEMGEPEFNNVVSIINAGWFFREKGYPTWVKRFNNMDLIGNSELLNRLLTKAVEIVFVKEAGSEV